MKYCFVLLVSTLFLVLQSCGSKGEPYDSSWVTKRITFEEEYICDCTESEKESLKNNNHRKVEQELNKYKASSNLDFHPDYTMNGTIMGDKVAGTYTTTPGEIYLDLEGYDQKQRLQIVRIGGEEFLQISLPENKLEAHSRSFNNADLGEVKMNLNKLKILLEQDK